MLATKGTTCRVISWDHFNYWHHMDSRLERCAQRIAARNSDAFVVLTREDYETEASVGHAQKSRLHQIYNPVEVPESPELLGQVDRTRFLAIGRLSAQKNLIDLLRAWNVARSSLDGYTLDLIGDGPDRERLERYVIQNDLQESVIFHGFVDNPSDYFAYATALVMSSKYEGYPMVILEALAHACASSLI